MPIYEYRRPDGSTFEVVQSFSDEPLTHDPETGVEVQRVLHPPAVHFKGKGFYNTDYGTRKRQRESAASGEGSSSGEGGSGGAEKGSGAGGDGGKDGSSKDGGGKTSTSSEGKSGGDAKGGGSKGKKSEPVAAKG
jgi:putative FmdB family regulatory protein